MGTQGVVFDIQRWSLHDGPGIRTNVFLKDVRFPVSGAAIRNRRSEMWSWPILRINVSGVEAA